MTVDLDPGWQAGIHATTGEPCTSEPVARLLVGAAFGVPYQQIEVEAVDAEAGVWLIPIPVASAWALMEGESGGLERWHARVAPVSLIEYEITVEMP